MCDVGEHKPTSRAWATALERGYRCVPLQAWVQIGNHGVAFRYVNTHHTHTPLTPTHASDREVCLYCDAYADIIREFEQPDHHTSARCVQGQEPIRNTERTRRTVAWSRAEDDSCQRGTPGCCIDHNHDHIDTCETW